MGQIKGLPSFMEGTWQGKGMKAPEVFDRNFVDELALWTLEWMDATGQTPKVFIGGHEETLQEKLSNEPGLADVLCYGRGVNLFSSFRKTDEGMKKTLFMDLDDVPEPVIEMVDGKQLPDVSVGLGLWNGHPIVEHVCLVGIEQPAVSGLSKIGKFTDVEPRYFVALSEITEPRRPGVFDKVKGGLKKMLTKSPAQQGDGGDLEGIAALLEEFGTRLMKDVDSKIGGFTAGQQARDQKAREADVASFTERLFDPARGMVPAPVLKPKIQALLLGSDESGKVTFTAPGKTEATTVDRDELLRDVLENMEFVRVGDGKSFTVSKPTQGEPDYSGMAKGVAKRQFTGVIPAAGNDDIEKTVKTVIAVINAQKSEK